jgi:oxepin-CoA hydrolase/3-oxo-5,6-dehydrosuberyl-CoA semialdehyde dehydrogenase
MESLRSFVAGNWHVGSASMSQLVNPATEAVLAQTSTSGIDFAEVHAYARNVGGPNLRALTFKQRGEMLRAMSKVIHAKREELFSVATENGGNTRGDAKFDVDGAWGTLAAYADLADTLGDARVLVDGDAIQLGRSPRLYGFHAYTPRVGVALHINAYNFPAWGLAEKAATALLAGMPVISKPATSTALLAARINELLVDAKVLPDGAWQFVCGSTGNLMDALDGQDVIGFTGSSGTAATLRAAACVRERGTHINVEADSLNAAVLGPDVTDGSDLMNLFLADVVRDMTQKTGQKCTAIRRVYVPRERMGEVIAALRERLAQVKVGNPSLAEVTMGPLATASQLRDVRKGVERLQTAATLVAGDPNAFEVLGREGDKGFFMPPLLFRCDAPKAGDVIHEHEVFGPVATVMPYDRVDDVGPLMSFGHGGLVASVYSDDRVFLGQAALAMAPYHGRICVGSSKIAAQAMPPGMVLPQLLHGGPGRAGGGEELGGRRGLALYMQRTAFQGDRTLLEPLLGIKST